MPPPRKVDLLPPDVRADLDRRIQANGFAGYAEISDWLASIGYEISVSRVAEHGKGMKETLRAVTVSTQAAQMVVEANPDEIDNRSAAVISLLQTGFFDLLVGMNAAEAEDNPDERAKLLANIAKSFAHLTRASTHLKDFQRETRARLEAAADKAAAIAQRGGLSADTVQSLRREILGVVNAPGA